jgi:hypothetical protein
LPHFPSAVHSGDDGKTSGGDSGGDLGILSFVLSSRQIFIARMLVAKMGMLSIVRGVLSQDRGASVRALGIFESEWELVVHLLPFCHGTMSLLSC